MKLRMVLRSAITAKSSVTSGKTASNLPVVCGSEAVTYTRSVLRKEIHLPRQHAVTVGWRTERKPIPPIIGAADTRRRKSQSTFMATTGSVFSSHLATPGVYFEAAL
jgi:hypothetical protein